MSSKAWEETAVCFSSRACRAHVSSHSPLAKTSRLITPLIISREKQAVSSLGIEWRGKLYSTHPVLLQPPTTYLSFILQRFWHTLSRVLLHSSQKQNIVIPKMTSEANSSHSPLFLGREHGKGQIYQLFSQWWSGEKGSLYKRENVLGLVAL